MNPCSPPELTTELPVAGMVPLTTIDYPGRLSMVVFTQGCPWRCPYCHNAGLRPMRSESAPRWTWVGIRKTLERRRGLLDAVVFSGGEPTLHDALFPAVREVRELGFLVGLHTAGILPDRLRQLLPWIDWVGLDIKAPLDERYARLTGDRRSAERVLSSLGAVRESAVSYQLRTTVSPEMGGEAGFREVCRQLKSLGAPPPVRQDAG